MILSMDDENHVNLWVPSSVISPMHLQMILQNGFGGKRLFFLKTLSSSLFLTDVHLKKKLVMKQWFHVCVVNCQIFCNSVLGMNIFNYWPVAMAMFQKSYSLPQGLVLSVDKLHIKTVSFHYFQLIISMMKNIFGVLTNTLRNLTYSKNGVKCFVMKLFFQILTFCFWHTPVSVIYIYINLNMLLFFRTIW